MILRSSSLGERSPAFTRPMRGKTKVPSLCTTTVCVRSSWPYTVTLRMSSGPIWYSVGDAVADGVGVATGTGTGTGRAGGATVTAGGAACGAA